MSNPQNGVLGTLYAMTSTGRSQVAPLAVVAQINVADPAGLTDTFVTFLSVDAAGRLRVLASAASGAVFPVSPAIQANSVGNFGSVVGPGANAAITTIAAGSLPAGTYDVQVRAVFLAGAPTVGADSQNWQVRRGATVIQGFTVPAVLGTFCPIFTVRCVLDGATAVSVNAAGAATAGVNYAADLTATRIA